MCILYSCISVSLYFGISVCLRGYHEPCQRSRQLDASPSSSVLSYSCMHISVLRSRELSTTRPVHGVSLDRSLELARPQLVRAFAIALSSFLFSLSDLAAARREQRVQEQAFSVLHTHSHCIALPRFTLEPSVIDRMKVQSVCLPGTRAQVK